MQAWRIEVQVRDSEPDPAGNSGHKALERAGLAPTSVRSRRGFLLGPGLTDAQVRTFARAVLADPVLETFTVHAPGAESPRATHGVHRVSILLRAGVTDPVAHSVQKALADLSLPVVDAATYRVYDVAGVEKQDLLAAARRALANAVVNDVLADIKASVRVDPGQEIYYPGEKELNTRAENMALGIPVDDGVWAKIRAL